MHEFDGRPAADVYAEIAGVPKEEIGHVEFATHGLGLMIDGKAWLRSGLARVDDSIMFACEVLEGMDVVKAVEALGDPEGKPSKEVLIGACGVLE